MTNRLYFAIQFENFNQNANPCVFFLPESSLGMYLKHEQVIYFFSISELLLHASLRIKRFSIMHLKSIRTLPNITNDIEMKCALELSLRYLLCR